MKWHFIYKLTDEVRTMNILFRIRIIILSKIIHDPSAKPENSKVKHAKSDILWDVCYFKHNTDTDTLLFTELSLFLWAVSQSVNNIEAPAVAYFSGLNQEFSWKSEGFSCTNGHPVCNNIWRAHIMNSNAFWPLSIAV